MRHIRPLVLTTALTLAAFSVSGCASRYGVQRTQVQFYPGCYQPIAQLRESEHSVLKGTAGGAALGVLAGALLGALAADRGDRGKSALIGGVVGGVSGGMMGNIHAQKQRIADENMRMASYLEDLEGDISGLDFVSASARTSLQCYDHQFQSLVEAIRARQVSRDHAERMFSEIRTGREEAIAILGQAETQGRELDRQYQAALDEEERVLEQPEQIEPPRAQQPQTARTQPRQPRQPQRLRTPAQKQKARDGIATAKQKRQTLNRKVDEIAKERQMAQAKNQADSQAVARMLDEIDA